jgi:hypothetical protein
MTRVALLSAIITINVYAVSAQPSASVRINGSRTVVLSASDFAAMPRTTVTATAHERQATYEGISIRQLLSRVGVPTGDALRGRELATAVVVTGADDYQVVFGIAEFDPGFTDRVAILADKRDGIALAGDEGPYQLIVPDEKRPARWVRQVVSIDIRPMGR